MATQLREKAVTIFQDPSFARALFSQPEWAWLWLIARVYVGWQWISAASNKLGNPNWVDTGATLKGFWERAIVVPDKGRPPITYGWYRDFIEFLYNGGHYGWFAKLVTYGELLIGIALVTGAFVGIAALFGALMNFNFMLAGSSSTNPVMFALAVLLILAWKTAGWWGVDRVLLPALGTPWQPGAIFGLGRKRAAERSAPTDLPRSNP
ncbi:MAG: DoxX family membrane protein [Chloroflexi bacterium]|nr:DoxX family membrane protein [Chloroflexota bacterium]